jgi:hypothetical protein
MALARRNEPERRRELHIAAASGRAAARIAVIMDCELSFMARCLYVLLDDYAGDRGEAWPRQQRLGVQLGVSARYVRTALGELGKYVTVERGRRGATYRLTYGLDRNNSSAQDVIRPEQGFRLHRNNSSAQGGGTPIYEPDHRNLSFPLSGEEQKPEPENHEPETTGEPEADTIAEIRKNLAARCWSCGGAGMRGSGANRSACGVCRGSGKAAR